MDEFIAENVLKAIDSMYGQNPLPNYKELDLWLKSFQKATVAWGIIGQLLLQENLSEPAYIFSAQTLKTKLSFDFEELKNTDLASFKINLLSLCTRFVDNTRVMRQLALCVGILGLHLVDTWGPAMFAELYAAFRDKPGLMLEILKCMAEVSSDETIVADQDTIIKYKNLLIRNSSDVLVFLQSMPNEFLVSILETFLEWLQLGLEPNVVNELPKSQLLPMCFGALNSPVHFQTAAGIICELIRATEDFTKYQDTITLIVNQVLLLREKALEAIRFKDTEAVEGYIKIFTTLGNTHILLIIRGQSDELLQILIEMLRVESYEGIKDVTNFWHKLCRNFRRALNVEEQSVKKETLAPFMMRILQICILQCKLDAELLYSIIPGKKLDDEIDDKRYHLSGAIQDISIVLGEAKTVQILHENLQQIFSENYNESEREKYCQIEAIAVCLQALSEILPEDNAGALQQPIILLTRQVWPILQLNLTICKMLSSASLRILQDSLSTIMTYLANCMTQPGTHHDSAAAFQAICQDNSYLLVQHVDSLLQLHTASHKMPDFSQEKILEGVSSVVWRCEDHTKILELCSYYATELKNITQQEQPNEEVFNENCDKLAIILKSSASSEVSKEGVYIFFKEMWPVLKRLIEVFQNSPDAIERICRIIKHSMKKLKESFGEFLSDFLPIISSLFQTYGHSSYLYMTENLVRIFGGKQEYNELLSQVFNTLSQSALARINSYEAMVNSPELTEDFFGMVIRYLNYCTHSTINSPSFQNIINTAKIGIGLQHGEAAKCLYGFLEVLADLADEKHYRYIPEVEEICLVHYGEILRKLIGAIIQVMPSEIYDCISDLCYKILTIFEASEWLKEALVGVPHDCLTESEKQKFVQQSADSQYVNDWLHKLHNRAKQRALRTR
ncbi:unnamed protein product [Blepharisma stoltei]|uniref:Exportin-1/Importin-beta-like domain-containing protein n=1 Tax=Blepharisma stoltei TaxID=1481888 RepID=A0AAU9JNH4_9CILI|nr:unnamed protein product [Blepharisma stoltei]